MTGTMGDYPDLSSSHIAIFGLGLMGGSLALALRDHCASVVGIDRDPAAVALARQKKAVDTASLEPTAFLSRCDLVILAVPVLAIIETLEKLPAWHKGNPVVMDLGSTKVQVVNAMEQLPARFDPIGGHPMCGKEKLSLENADPLLYYNAPFALTPLPRTTEKARAIALHVIKILGARPVWLDPGTHDQWTAATSHFPYLIASLLARATPAEVAPLVGPGFRSTTRLAATPLSIMLDILISNRENILHCSQRFRQAFDEMERLLAKQDYACLQDFLAFGNARHRELTSEPEGKDE